MDSPSKSLQVLDTSELLYAIFQHLNKSSNASNARVSRRWSDIALDILWQDLQDILPLFRILAPLSEERKNFFKFTRALQLDDWKAFDRYRYRVRSLTCRYEAKSIHHNVFHEISKFSTSQKLLPNMHTLAWRMWGEDMLDICTLFMHQDIKSFAITAGEMHLPSFASLLEEVGERMQSLTQLTLKWDFPISFIEPIVMKLLSKLINLRQLTVPPCCFTSKIAEAVLHNKALESFECCSWQTALENVSDLNPQLQDGAYPSLKKLHLSASFRNMEAFLAIPFANLTDLRLNSNPIVEQLSGGFSELAVTIGQHCQGLRLLDLQLERSHWHEVKTRKEMFSIAIDNLRPLFKCANLTLFYISHHYPLRLQLVDIEEIAVAWPSMEYIRLNNAPCSIGHSDLTLDALLPFVRHCPELRELGLFLDATKGNPQLESVGLAHPRFRALRYLHMGRSVFYDGSPTNLALLLSHIFPLDCETKIDWTEWGYKLEAACHHDGTWRAVDEWLPVLMQCRKLGREEGRKLSSRSKR